MACHYLSKSNYECTLTKGGVFIPLQAHFDQFCLTDSFMLCGHYCRLAAPLGDSDSPYVSEQLQGRGRRQFIRKQQQFSVGLCPCGPSGSVESGCDENARILDYSQGGVRVLASRAIAESDMLSFRFGRDFIVPELHGLAVVRWQKPAAVGDAERWEAGLAFESHLVKALIAVQMNM